MSTHVSGVFAYRDRVLEAIGGLKEEGFRIRDVLMPVPDHEILDAIRLRKSLVGYITLLGGLFGVVFGFGGASYTHLLWGLIVSGKPVVSVPPFVIVGFEMLILFGGLATLLGLFLLTRMPRLKHDKFYDERASEDHYVVIVEAEEERVQAACDILAKAGGEVWQ
jgi:molybdopterin-containing oxidoreductase family membrane subunit